MIEGLIHILGVGEGNLYIVFTSLHGTGSYPVPNRKAAEHFISGTLRCEVKPGDMDCLMGRQLEGIKAKISIDQYDKYFSK
jgi:hypothetical protein